MENNEEVTLQYKGEKGRIITPEGITMLISAIIFDSAGLLDFFPIIGWIASSIANASGFLFFIAWFMLRRKVGATSKIKVGKAAKWAKRRKWIRPLFMVLNLFPVPYVFSLVPLWTVVVLVELIYGS